jgi:hypothetical protein
MDLPCYRCDARIADEVDACPSCGAPLVVDGGRLRSLLGRGGTGSCTPFKFKTTARTRILWELGGYASETRDVPTTGRTFSVKSMAKD